MKSKQGEEVMKEKIKEKGKMEKREKPAGKKRKGLKVGGLALAIFCVVAVFASWLIFRDGEAVVKKLTGSQVLDKVNYKNQNVAMTPLDATLSGAVLEVPLEAVKEKKLVSFVYRNQGKQIPLMAYITPSGRLVTAVAMCEPCKSTKFHIEGNIMVCNSCFTKWELESLEGISGGCLKYPPDVLGHTVQGKKILIKETDVLSWKPRV